MSSKPKYWFLNDKKIELQTNDKLSLLSFLRKKEQIISTKIGCDNGECGACTVLIDGEPQLACQTKISTLANKKVMTLEGLPQESKELYMQVFSTNSKECYFCLPGLTMRLHALLQKTKTPSRKIIQELLGKHLCHCTGYIALNEAIQHFVQPKYTPKTYEITDDQDRHKIPQLPQNTPSQALQEVFAGKTHYVTDLHYPNTLHGVFLNATCSHGKILEIDTTDAEEMEGVQSIILAQDLPDIFLEKISTPRFVGLDQVINSVSDVLALVLADSAEIARQAAESIIVEVEEYEPLTNIEYLQQQGETYLLARTHLTKGDTTKAFHNSTFVLSTTWHTPMRELTFIPLPATLAYPTKDKKLHIYTHSNTIDELKEKLPQFLSLPHEDCLIQQTAPKEQNRNFSQPCLEIYAAFLALKYDRPVQIALSREDTFMIAPKSPAARIHLSISANKQGDLTGIRARILMDHGASSPYARQILQQTVIHACGPYRIPNFDLLAEAIRTNNPPTTITATAGIVEITFAIEGAINLLAKHIKLDSWAIRYRNALKTGDMLPNGQFVSKNRSIIQSLETIREAYYKHDGKVGIACSMLGYQLNTKQKRIALLQLHVDITNEVTLQLPPQPPQSLGQDFYTALLQIASEESGIPQEHFHLVFSEELALLELSRNNPANAILITRATREAARKIKIKLDAKKDITNQVFIGYSPDIPHHSNQQNYASLPHYINYNYATHLVVLNPSNGRIERYIAAHDLSKAINPNATLRQLEASIYEGMSHALTEKQSFKNGVPQYLTFQELNSIQPTHIPHIKFQILINNDNSPEEPHDELNGDIGFLPVAAALSDAISKREQQTQYKIPMRETMTSLAHQPNIQSPKHSL